MADTKISALTAATTPLAGTEVLPIVQSSTTKKVAVSDLTAGRSVSATSFVPTGSTVPANGMYLPTTNTLAWSTNSVQNMTLDASGNLGVGTTSPSTYGKFAVVGTVGNFAIDANGTNAEWNSDTTSGNNDPSRLNTYRTRSGGAVASGDNLMWVMNYGYDGAAYRIASNIKTQVDGAVSSGVVPGRITFSTTNSSGVNAERARITSAGNLLIGTTSTTANGGVLQVSNGITFPATDVPCSDANTLDDYEEGTWTPTLVSTGGGTPTYNAARSGSYTKIGRQVTVLFYMYIDGPGTLAAGNLSIQNLPFTKANSVDSARAMIDFYFETGGTASIFVEASIGNNSTTIFLNNATAATTDATGSNLTVAKIGSAATLLRGCLTYFV